jgi:hypothetical protein
MPLNQIAITPILYGALTGAGIIGSLASPLSIGLANALCIYGTSSMNVTTIDVGVLGSGKGFGVGVILPVPILTSSLSTSMPAAGFLGASAPQLINGISIGYSETLATAIINTVHPNVGVGTGKLQVFPNTAVAINIFVTAFAAAGLSGSMAVSLATAVASGLDSSLISAQGVVAITGSPSVIPSTGVGLGKLL